MSRNHLWAWVGVVCLLCAGAVYAQQDRTASDGNAANSSAVAAVPRLIKYSGEVKDARGEPVTSAAVRLTFGVYEEQQGGAALWVESQMVQLDEQGHYTVLLGATRADGLPVELFPAGKPRWLGVQVEGRDEDPRVLLVSVPYALKAEDAAMLGGRSASDFVLAEQLREEVRTQVEAQKPGIATQAVEMLVNNPPNVPAITEGPSTFTCATTGDCVAVTQSSTGRALRATATSASEAALLQQNGTGYGLRVLSQSNYAIYGVVQGTVMGTTYGVRGLVNSTTGAGILGSNQATTGVAYGLMGQTSSVSGIGLYGRALATTGTTVGLTGDADSTSGRGIMGRATATSGTTMGIYAEARSAGGTALVVNNTAGGNLLSGQANGAEKLQRGRQREPSLRRHARRHAIGLDRGQRHRAALGHFQDPGSQPQRRLARWSARRRLCHPGSQYVHDHAEHQQRGSVREQRQRFPACKPPAQRRGDQSGWQPFLHAYGGANTFVGDNAGNFTMTGTFNTASGTNALYSNTDGQPEHRQRQLRALLQHHGQRQHRQRLPGALRQHRGHGKHRQRLVGALQKHQRPRQRRQRLQSALQQHGQRQHGGRNLCARFKHQWHPQHRGRRFGALLRLLGHRRMYGRQ